MSCPSFVFFRPVAEAADIMRQKLAAIVNVDIIRDAVLQDALAQGDQRRLRARRVRNVTRGKDARPRVKKCGEIEAVPGAVRPLGDHVKRVVIRDPPLVARHIVVYTTDIWGAAVSVCLLAFAAQHLDGHRHICLEVPGERLIAWDGIV